MDRLCCGDGTDGTPWIASHSPGLHHSPWSLTQTLPAGATLLGERRWPRQHGLTSASISHTGKEAIQSTSSPAALPPSEDHHTGEGEGAKRKDLQQEEKRGDSLQPSSNREGEDSGPPSRNGGAQVSVQQLPARPGRGKRLKVTNRGVRGA